MKSPRHFSPDRSSSGFTMIEIAISLAVIAFALVAIIGVMPTGMQVQRDNREETIINQEAILFTSAIRNGSRGMDDLTNYVLSITNFYSDWEVTTATTNKVNEGFDGYTNTTSDIHSFAPAPVYPLINGRRIIGLLGRPKYEPLPPNGANPVFRSNYVVAYVRALSGLASEKAPQDNPDVVLGSFSYRVTVENMQVPQFYNSAIAGGEPFGKQLTNNLHELRLLFRWPLNPRNIPGNGRYTFRTTIGGQLVKIDDPDVTPVHPLFFFDPQNFVTAK